MLYNERQGGNRPDHLTTLMLGSFVPAGVTGVATHVSLITAGGIQSNHARLTAAVWARLGLACELILTRTVPKSAADYELNGNRLLDHLFGAH